MEIAVVIVEIQTFQCHPASQYPRTWFMIVRFDDLQLHTGNHEILFVYKYHFPILTHFILSFFPFLFPFSDNIDVI